MTKFYPAKTIVKQKNLLKKGSEEEEQEQEQAHENEEESVVIENDKSVNEKQAEQVIFMTWLLIDLP